VVEAAETIYPGTRARQGRRLLGLRLTDAAVIAALCAVVGLVSLPRLADYVRRSNEQDARIALDLLGPACFPLGAVNPAGDPTDLGAWGPSLRHRLRDARPLEDASALLYHGYLFALRPTRAGETWLIAWPRLGGRTGSAVLAWAPAQGALCAEPACQARWVDPAGDQGALDPDEWHPVGD